MAKPAVEDTGEDETEKLVRKEREKRVLHWATAAPVMLKTAYRLMVGLTPPKSWSFVMDKSAEKLVEMETASGIESVERFLREAMTAFILRCRGGYQKEPESPFFADSYVFSSSALSYMQNQFQRIRKYSWMAADPHSFPKKVYELVFSVECEYWTLGAPNVPPMLDLIRPEVYWVIFSAACGRVSWDEKSPLNPLAKLWHHWDHEVDHMGVFQPLEQAVHRERQRLKSDKVLLETAKMAAGEAIWDAALNTWQRLGLGRITTDDGGRMVLPNDGVELQPFKFDIEGEKSLWEWEKSWREYLCGKLGLEYDPDAFEQACVMGTASHRPMRRSAAAEVSSILGVDSRQSVDPFILAAMGDGTR